MFPLGIFLANAGPMFEKNLLNPFAITKLPVTFLASSLNWVGYCELFFFLLIRVFSRFLSCSSYLVPTYLSNAAFQSISKLQLVCFCISYI